MDTPQGLEVLLKKASVDAAFRVLLLEQRSGACTAIGLDLDPAESAMLDGLPTEQLDVIIQRTRVPAEDRRIFLGKVASLMLATLGAGASGCRKQDESGPRPTSRGHRVDNPGRPRPTPEQSPGTPMGHDPKTDATC